MEYIVLPTYEDVKMYIYTSTMRYSKTLHRYICLICETYDKGLTLIKQSISPYINVIVINGFFLEPQIMLKEVIRSLSDVGKTRYIVIVPTTLRFMLPVQLYNLKDVSQYIFLEARNLIEKQKK